MPATNLVDEMPQSVEEAGALLGATVIGYGNSSFVTTPPPKGIHSSFTTISPVPSSELFHRLHMLRSLLRSAPRDTPLVAAPSLLAGVLMKLLGISNSLAANLNNASSSLDPTKRSDVPPMLSTPIRRVWVQCVVLCHSLGEGLSGNARINLYGFVRDMIILAGLNPRTARALGGTRIAALEVISGLLEDSKLSTQLASWAYDIIQLCQRALKSSGNGEPTYRIAAVKTACSVAVASRMAFLKARSVEGSALFVLKGALDDKAIFEATKLLKVAVQDKLPEVRSCGATLACLLAPLVINLHIKSPSSPDAQATSPTTSLEDIMTLAFKNLDDESVEVSGMLAEALARCMCTSIEYKNQSGGDEGGSTGKAGHSTLTGRGSRKGILPAAACDTVPKAMKYLISVFIKVGGDLAAPRAGGSFSVGGRAVRVGFARGLIHFLRLQSGIHSLGDGRALSYKEAILIILSMVGSDMEAQLNPTDRSAPLFDSLDATTVMTPGIAAAVATLSSPTAQAGRHLFGQGPKLSLADACMARLLTARVFREGLSEVAAETTQLAFLHELVSLCKNKQEALKGNQLQVILVEISHLFATLGEATESSLEELLPALLSCLRHRDHGVRHEAAIVGSALASVFPSEGRKLLRKMLDSIQLEHAELMSAASSQTAGGSADSFGPASRFRFGRNAPMQDIKANPTLKGQYAIHGMALTASMILRDLPTLPGGLPSHLLRSAVSVSEALVSTMSNNALRDNSPSGVCTCVRAGFGLICGSLTTGPDAVSSHIALVFQLWQGMSSTEHQTKIFSADHEMVCVEAMLTSIVAFLKYCSELLLSIPDALSRTTLILENLLPAFFGKGKFGPSPANPFAAARLESSKASILECFAWLPPGSYPMIADSVFDFAAFHIQTSIHSDICCSILSSLVSSEDALLDAVSFSRANRLGQTGGAKILESDIIARTSEAAYHGDRESAFSFLGKQREINGSGNGVTFLDSEVLGLFAREKKGAPPTVLHEVGTWRTPVDPSCATRVRLVDAAIQAFASTFGLKSGKEQQKAIDVLQSLLPPAHLQGGRSLGTTDQERIGKSKDNLAATTNVAAVLLSCVKTLPMDESTHDIPVGLGPTWMNSASKILLNILPSPSNQVRRAAAEGLAFLATLGVKEDMHFLQSSVLHSLDEIISRTTIVGQGRNPIQDDFQAGRSGGLLTLACMQRNTYQIKERRTARSRLRGSPGSRSVDGEDSLPAIQIMIKLLPYVSGQPSPGTSFAARTFALHALLLLLEYSRIFKHRALSVESLHLLKKATETVEDNFVAAWTIASHIVDQGTESVKVAVESSFVSVVLRFMTFLTPYLHNLLETDARIARRFATMGIVIAECLSFHPVVQCEAMAFFEVLTDYRSLLPPHSGGIKYDEHPILCTIPFMMANITPNRSRILRPGIWSLHSGCHSSGLSLQATLKVLRVLAFSHIMVAEWSGMKAVSLLFSAMESAIAATTYSGEIYYRGLAAPRESEAVYNTGERSLGAIPEALRFLLYLERKSSSEADCILLRFILLARSLLVGNSGPREVEDEDEEGGCTVHRVAQSAMQRASLDAQPVFETTNSIRWQLKSIAAQMANIALMELARKHRQSGKTLFGSAIFNPGLGSVRLADECRAAGAQNARIPESLLSCHIADLVTASCVAATATVDQVELRTLQDNSMHFLLNVLDCFGAIPDPNDAGTSVLSEYVPQLSSCIKSALVAQDEEFNDSTCRLFFVGCDALRTFLRRKVTDDKGVVKRLTRPALLSSEEVPFFTVEQSGNSSSSENIEADDLAGMRSALLVKIGKVWALELLPLSDPEIARMLETDSASLGAHAAALAIDGARILLGANLTLTGRPSKDTSANLSSGFFSFRNLSEVDEYTKAAFLKTWAANAKTSVKFLGEVVAAPDTSSEVRGACIDWLKLISPLVFHGLYDVVDGLYLSPAETMQCANEIDSEEVASSCISAIEELAECTDYLELAENWKRDMHALLIHVHKNFLLPTLAQMPPHSKGKATRQLTSQFCSLLITLASSSSSYEEKRESSDILLTFLGPLQMLEKNEVDLSSELVAMIISAYITSVASIIKSRSASTALVKAMISLVLSLSTRTEKVPNAVKNASQNLLEQCVKQESVSAPEHSLIALTLAKARDWATWSVVIKVDEGAAAEKSLIEIEKLLLNPSYAGEQLTALAAIRSLVQSSPPPNLLTGRIVAAIGAENLSVFQAYGILKDGGDEVKSQRLAACADCLKIALAAYQQFSADCTEEEISEYLIVLFDAFIAVIRFNGLPNHPPPQGAFSDASIGRMCAQAITHVARTTPAPFKKCMGAMSDQDRTVLEFAVRAEMTGYANAAAPAPAKKKLSLKSFKK